MPVKHYSLSLSTLGLVIGLAQPAISQSTGTPIGKIDASIDGTSYAGATLKSAKGTGTASFRSFGPMSAVSIQGHDLTADNFMHNVLTVEFSVMGNDATGAVMDASVSWWPEGMNNAFYHSENSGTETKVTLDALALDAGESVTDGSFSALLCRKESFFAEADTDNCLPVEGTFGTALVNPE
ncbi:hypothetical protein [Pontibaca salina]|uniref:Uncharacterized protein n=1 Tax=Pontibaca salina TaxID=2795731 RepID=A0A934M105_9RHOB|nr:hypothetical protein [Pontibaca salina]MBI6629186.1 hypothetical protein [Pontibaca salina]